MLNRTEKLLINVIGDTIKSKKNEYKADLKNEEWIQFYKLSVSHKIENIIGYAAESIINMPEELKQYFLQKKNHAIVSEARQEIVVGQFIDEMENRGYDCMPLKGYVIKNLYPYPDMRYMTDTDILIKEKQYPGIKKIMDTLGMSFDHESIHEYVFKNKQMMIELHKTIVPPSSERAFRYFGSGWSRAKLKPNHNNTYEMSMEDMYIHSVEHAARHYVGGGIGIRHIVDIFLLNQYKIDYQYIEENLEKMNLVGFNRAVCNLAQKWFDREEADDKIITYMERFILNNGAFGTVKSAAVSGIYKSAETDVGKYGKSKFRLYIRAVFPKPAAIKILYPVCRKYPFLYPVYIVIRWKDVFFKRRENIAKRFYIKNINEADVIEFSKHCQNIGLGKDI